MLTTTLTQPAAIAALLDRYTDPAGIAQAVGCCTQTVGWWMKDYPPQLRYRPAIARALDVEPEAIRWGKE